MTQYFNEAETSVLTGWSCYKLRMDRRGGMPKLPYIRLGRHVAYRATDIETYLQDLEKSEASKVGQFSLRFEFVEPEIG